MRSVSILQHGWLEVFQKGRQSKMCRLFLLWVPLKVQVTACDVREAGEVAQKILSCQYLGSFF